MANSEAMVFTPLMIIRLFPTNAQENRLQAPRLQQAYRADEHNLLINLDY